MTHNSRINLKMQLQKAQAEQQQRRAAQAVTASSTPSSAIFAPRPMITSSSVPGEVLQVQSTLQHPTRYHVQQKQRDQVVEYLSNSVGNTKSAVSHLLLPRGSLPNASTTGNSAPASPLSRLKISSSADQLPDEIFNDLESIASSYDEDRSQLSTTLPTINRNDLNTYAASTASKLPVYVQNTTSSSCPPEIIPKQEYLLEEDDSRSYMQDRVKKDNHNRIERRRRYNINDRIKELGTLIPKSNDPDTRWNKGSILKVAVDHMRELQSRMVKSRQSELKLKQMQNLSRKLLLRIQELETLLQSQGIDVPPMQEKQDIVNSLFSVETAARFENSEQQFFTQEEEFEVANFPSQPVSQNMTTLNPNFSQGQISPTVMHPSPQPSNTYFTSVTQTTHSPISTFITPPPQQQQQQQPQQHIVAIDITSPTSSLSPQPPQDEMMSSLMQHQNNQEMTIANDSLMAFNDTSFSSLLNESEEVNIESMMMEEDVTPIKYDIFLSDSVQRQ